MKKTVLVIFGDEAPKKNKGWWKQFNTLIAPQSLQVKAEENSLIFENIDHLLLPGNIREASEFTRSLSLLKTADGCRLSKQVMYKGYELWWTHYDDLYYFFCFPYTQYRDLLAYLKNFEAVVLYNPPFTELFTYYLGAYRRPCKVLDKPRQIFLPFSLWLQLLLSVPFLLWLLVWRPPLMIWTSDLFDPPRDHDFRYRFVYEEIYKKNISFVEFIRSQERWRVTLEHALKRRRPVIYTHAISIFLRLLASAVSRKYIHMIHSWHTAIAEDPEKDFWFSVATHYLRNARGDMWAISAIRFALRCVGIRAAIIPAGNSRNFREVLACKTLHIPIVGIFHGIASKDYNVYDFMPEYDGEKSISVDRYGVWSQWWKEYYTEHSRVYTPKQLMVSGPMRPLTERHPLLGVSHSGPLKVLFMSEQLGVPSETLPYLEALLDARDLNIYLKFRPYRDGFEEWLKKNRPDILEKIGQERILRGGVSEALTQCDIVVGSHSTAVLEALLQLKPFVFFESKKWEDQFELKSLNSPHSFFAQTPPEFVELVRKSRQVPKEILKELQQRFFGDPYCNGSAWVVEQVEGWLGERTY